MPDLVPVEQEQALLRTEETKLEIAQIRSRRRKLQLQAIDDYLGFTCSKAVGFGAAALGGLETLLPNFLNLTIDHPEALLGVGLAVLVGKKAVDLASKVLDALRD